MKKLLLLFTVVSCSIYSADIDFKKEFIQIFFNLILTPEIAAISVTEKSEKKSPAIQNYMFAFFDMLQRSDANARQERAYGYGQFECDKSLYSLSNVNVILRQWHPDSFKKEVMSMDRVKVMLDELESLKRFQVGKRIPVLSKKLFDTYYESHVHATIQGHGLELEALEEFNKGFKKQYELRGSQVNQENDSNDSDDGEE